MTKMTKERISFFMLMMFFNCLIINNLIQQYDFSSMIVSLLLERGRLMNLLLPLVKMCIILIILLISFPIFVLQI